MLPPAMFHRGEILGADSPFPNKPRSLWLLSAVFVLAVSLLARPPAALEAGYPRSYFWTLKWKLKASQGLKRLDLGVLLSVSN